jgi:hypothetical protein
MSNDTHKLAFWGDRLTQINRITAEQYKIEIGRNGNVVLEGIE